MKKRGELCPDDKDPEWRLVDESDRKFVTTPREIEEQLKSEMSGMHDHIRKELKRVELELQMEFGESL